MPIVERGDGSLSKAFTEVTGKPVHSIGKSIGGLDNSVYYIHLNEDQPPQYVLKVIESKADEQIQDSIILNNDLREFTKLEFLQLDSGSYLHSSEHIDKKFVIMNFLPGRHPDISNQDDSQTVATFAAKLHNSLPRQLVSPKELLQQELDMISTYYSNGLVRSMEMVEGEQGDWYKKRALTYKRCNSILSRALNANSSQFDDENYYITRGVTHGDLNAGNMIIDADGKPSFIDPDSFDRNGFQISDILHAVSKSNIVNSAEKTNDFLDCYLKKKGDCSIDKKMFRTLLFCLSFRAALSTDYYTKEVGTIQKISTDWVYNNAKDTLDKLSTTLKTSAKILGVDAGIFSRDEEESQITR